MLTSCIISTDPNLSQKVKQIIFTVLSPREMYLLEEYVNRIDPNAFIAVPEAYEILGKGFKALSEKVEGK